MARKWRWTLRIGRPIRMRRGQSVRYYHLVLLLLLSPERERLLDLSHLDVSEGGERGALAARSVREGVAPTRAG